MKKWKCPHCKKQIRAIGSEVTHRCPSNKNKVTAFELIEETENQE